MHPYQLLTPQMIELLLPTLGFSLILNFLLLSVLIFRSIRRWVFTRLYTYWLGFQMIWRANE